MREDPAYELSADDALCPCPEVSSASEQEISRNQLHALGSSKEWVLPSVLSLKNKTKQNTKNSNKQKATTKTKPNKATHAKNANWEKLPN